MTKKEELLEIINSSELNTKDKEIWREFFDKKDADYEKIYDAILDILKENKKAITIMTNFIKEGTGAVSGEGAVDLEKYKKELEQLLD